MSLQSCSLTLVREKIWRVKNDSEVICRKNIYSGGEWLIRDAENGTVKSETETEKFSDLIEKQICDRQTQNLRLRDPLPDCARFRDLGRICRDFHF